jgi:hypothetical protein
MSDAACHALQLRTRVSAWLVLRDSAPVFDRLGRWFTLVCVGFAPGDALPAAAARRG